MEEDASSDTKSNIQKMYDDFYGDINDDGATFDRKRYSQSVIEQEGSSPISKFAKGKNGQHDNFKLRLMKGQETDDNETKSQSTPRFTKDSKESAEKEKQEKEQQA